MYLHDYYLAYDNVTPWDYWTNSPQSKLNNWMLDGPSSEWTMVRADRAPSSWQELPNGLAIMVLPFGRGTISGFAGNRLMMVRPVFYVKNDIKLFGKGTKDDPYIIMQKDEEGKYYYDYEYTGDVQTFTVPEDGTYKIELWGASGGDKDQYKGGNGAYTSGLITLSQNSKLYIYVGGAGSETDYGGYNGGGNIISGQSYSGASGGGATDIRLEPGSWNNFNSLKSRIMVAAGGGAANNRNRSVDEYWYGAGNGGSGGGNGGGRHAGPASGI